MSQIIVRPRQAGKTFVAVKWVLAGEATDSYPGWSRVLIAHSIAEADRIRRDYPDLDYRQVFPWDEWKNARLGRKPVEVLVDNADTVLTRLLGQPIAGATWSGGVS